MRVNAVHHQTRRVLVVVCDKGEEAIATIVYAIRGRSRGATVTDKGVTWG